MNFFFLLIFWFFKGFGSYEFLRYLKQLNKNDWKIFKDEIIRKFLSIKIDDDEKFFNKFIDTFKFIGKKFLMNIHIPSMNPFLIFFQLLKQLQTMNFSKFIKVCNEQNIIDFIIDDCFYEYKFIPEHQQMIDKNYESNVIENMYNLFIEFLGLLIDCLEGKKALLDDEKYSKIDKILTEKYKKFDCKQSFIIYLKLAEILLLFSTKEIDKLFFSNILDKIFDYFQTDYLTNTILVDSTNDLRCFVNFLKKISSIEYCTLEFLKRKHFFLLLLRKALPIHRDGIFQVFSVCLTEEYLKDICRDEEFVMNFLELDLSDTSRSTDSKCFEKKLMISLEFNSFNYLDSHSDLIGLDNRTRKGKEEYIIFSPSNLTDNFLSLDYSKSEDQLKKLTEFMYSLKGEFTFKFYSNLLKSLNGISIELRKYAFLEIYLRDNNLIKFLQSFIQFSHEMFFIDRKFNEKFVLFLNEILLFANFLLKISNGTKFDEIFHNFLVFDLPERNSNTETITVFQGIFLSPPDYLSCRYSQKLRYIWLENYLVFVNNLLTITDKYWTSSFFSEQTIEKFDELRQILYLSNSNIENNRQLNDFENIFLSLEVKNIRICSFFNERITTIRNPSDLTFHYINKQLDSYLDESKKQTKKPTRLNYTETFDFLFFLCYNEDNLVNLIDILPGISKFFTNDFNEKEIIIRSAQLVYVLLNFNEFKEKFLKKKLVINESILRKKKNIPEIKYLMKNIEFELDLKYVTIYKPIIFSFHQNDSKDVFQFIEIFQLSTNRNNILLMNSNCKIFFIVRKKNCFLMFFFFCFLKHPSFGERCGVKLRKHQRFALFLRRRIIRDHTFAGKVSIEYFKYT